MYLSDYLTERGVHRIRLGWAVPRCNAGCLTNWLKDGYCDKACNTSRCLWDGGDCLGGNQNESSPEAIYNFPQRLLDMGIGRYRGPNSLANKLQIFRKRLLHNSCSPNCDPNWLNDGTCDAHCNTKSCGFDLGDCNQPQFASIASFQSFEPTNASFLVQPLHWFKYRFQTSNPVIGLNFTRFIHQYTISMDEIARNRTIGRSRLAIETKKNKELHLMNVSSDSPEIITSSFDVRKRLLMILLKNPMNNETVSTYLEIILNGIVLNLQFAFEIDYRSKESSTQSGLIVQSQPPTSERPTKSYHDSFPLHDSLNFNSFNSQIVSPASTELSRQAGHSDVKAGRRLLDIYLDTLLHVDYLYNRHFKIESRLVPPHMPLMIDRRVMQRMQDTFPDEIDRTSSHQLRDSNDMQFAFSYVYFLMSEIKVTSAEEVFRSLDTDDDGYERCRFELNRSNKTTNLI